MLERFFSTFLTIGSPWNYLLVFGILLACGLGVPIPEDVTLFLAGLFAYYGSANIYLMIAVSWVGVMLGDSIIFYLGYRFGPRILRTKIFQKILHEERMAQVQKMIREKGNGILFAARFMPGLRAPVYFSCGSLKVPYRIFFLYDGLAATLSVPAIVYLTYHFGDQFDRIRKVIQSFEHGIAILILCVVLFLILKWYIKSRKK